MTEPLTIRPAWVAPGKRVALCNLCRWASMPLSGEGAARVGEQHLRDQHPEVTR